MAHDAEIKAEGRSRKGVCAPWSLETQPSLGSVWHRSPGGYQGMEEPVVPQNWYLEVPTGPLGSSWKILSQARMSVHTHTLYAEDEETEAQRALVPWLQYV